MAPARLAPPGAWTKGDAPLAVQHRIALLAAALILIPAVADAAPLPRPAHTSIALQDDGALAHHPETISVFLAAAQHLGARSTRFVVRAWEGPERLAAYDGAVDRAISLGVQPQVAVSAKSLTTPADILRLVERWPTVRTWSVGNEPELMGLDACEYKRLWDRTAPRIRALGKRVLFGEFSPHGTVSYLQRVVGCPGPRITADGLAWHAYWQDSDPLDSRNTSRATRGEDYWGIGRAAGLRRALRSVRSRLSTPRGFTLPVLVTEFSYSTRGVQATTASWQRWAWPRVYAQARRHATQLVVYGVGQDGPASNWPGAGILSASGGYLAPSFNEEV